jgi:hypothetical protein
MLGCRASGLSRRGMKLAELGDYEGSCRRIEVTAIQQLSFVFCFFLPILPNWRVF